MCRPNAANYLLLPLLLITLFMTGCARHQQLLPIRDPHLRRPAAELMADSASRFPYPADAPRAGQADARAQVAHVLNRLEVVNLSNEDWYDVELWVNRSYVVYLPEMPSRELKQINFQLIYNDHGQHFPTRGAFVDSLEMVRNGQLYSITARVAH